MNHTFHYIKKQLHCEQVALRDVARRFGTPLYVMSRNHIEMQYAEFARAFAPIDPLICYAVKANFNLSIIRIVAKLGAGADVGSEGELFRARKSGVSAKVIVFSGVGKTSDEIAYALREGVLFLKVESLAELQQISRVAQKLRMTARIALRVNPDVTAQTHAHIATGGKDKKFGIDAAQIGAALRLIKKLPRVELVGLDVQIGSQLPSPAPFVRTLRTLLRVKRDIEAQGFRIDYLDLGGGFPIAYRAEAPQLSLQTFADAMIPLLKNCGATVVFEPGRFLVGNAGALLTRVLYCKTTTHGKNFVVVDAGTNELIRPVLYGAYHHIIPAQHTARTITADIVGPICESSDCFAYDRTIADVAEGELLAIMTAGAYGSTMGSNYNGRLRPAEVLVSGKKVRVIRARETLKQMIRNEE